MQFKDVVGQYELKKKIIQLVQQNHIPHAIMLLGAEGSGGLPLAIAMAQYIMCKEKTDSDSCNSCSNCVKINKLQHPDLHFSFPFCKTDDRKPLCNEYFVDFKNFIIDNPYASDTDWIQSLDAAKQGNITADECRDILRKLYLRSYESEFKVFIMWYPEYMGKEGNILLKFIEEPTAKTILLFVAENLEEVLPTIQSRAQLFPLKRLQDEEIKNALVERQVPEQKAMQIARLSDGNFHKALYLINHNNDDFFNLTRNWLNAIYQNKGLELMQWHEEITEGSKETQKNFLLYFIQLLEHTVRYRVVGRTNMSLLENELKIIENLISKGLSEYMIEEMSHLINDALFQIERNANTKILFHALSLRIQQIILRKKAMA